MLVPALLTRGALHFWECNYLLFIAEIRATQICATRPCLIIDQRTVTTNRMEEPSKSIGLYRKEVTQNPDGMTYRHRCIAMWYYACKCFI